MSTMSELWLLSTAFVVANLLPVLHETIVVCLLLQDTCSWMALGPYDGCVRAPSLGILFSFLTYAW